MRYAYIEAGRFIVGCFLLGATLGTITALIRGERAA